MRVDAEVELRVAVQALVDVVVEEVEGYAELEGCGRLRAWKFATREVVAQLEAPLVEFWVVLLPPMRMTPS